MFFWILGADSFQTNTELCQDAELARGKRPALGKKQPSPRAQRGSKYPRDLFTGNTLN